MQRYGGFSGRTNDLHEGRNCLHEHWEEALMGMQLCNMPRYKDRNNAKKASYSIYSKGMQDNFESETKALKQLDAFLSLKRMVIVTYDEQGTVPLDNGKQIEVIPAWKWLLE